MSKYNQSSIKEAIQDLLKTYRLDGKLNEVKLLNSWEKVMGKMIANHTKDIYISKKKLFIKVDSAALRQELAYAKEKIVNMLNEEVGMEVIDGVVLQ